MFLVLFNLNYNNLIFMYSQSYQSFEEIKENYWFNTR